MWRWPLLLWLAVVAAAAAGGASGGDVSYDGRSIIVDGKRKLLFSGSIHYPRSTPDMWPYLISQAKQGGLDAMDTYVFWNLHEPQPGQYYFSGRRDIVKFIKEVQSQGLYVCLRIGPFIQGEWSYGGLPFWLHDVPGIVYRSDNEPFKETGQLEWDAQNGKQANLNGTERIENEYQNVEKAFGAKGPPYVRWAAAMAVGLDTGVPWVMCKQDDAPDPVYHGGTNFGRNASAFMLTSYYDEAPLDEYGLIRQPKWGHLKELHAAVKQCTQTLLYGSKTNISLGALQQAYVYDGSNSECAAFLVNRDDKNETDVQFQNRTYKLPPESISILPDCKTEAFNTSKVNAGNSVRTRKAVVKLDSNEKWQEFNEVITMFDETSLRSNFLLEQMNTTKDTSDYLWYTTSYMQIEESQSLMKVNSRGHVLRAFVNGQLIGSEHGTFGNQSFNFEKTIALKEGANNISLLSSMIGMPNSGAFMERKAFGLANVTIGDTNLSNFSWGYQVGLLGEKLQFYTNEGSSKVKWSNLTSSSRPLKWYKSNFDAPSGNESIALNLGSMGKGEAWINGKSIGRYWISFLTPQGSPSQIWYHIPRSFLKAKDNLLVVFEEEIGNPLGISIDTVSVTVV